MTVASAPYEDAPNWPDFPRFRKSAHDRHVSVFCAASAAASDRRLAPPIRDAEGALRDHYGPQQPWQHGS